MRRSLRLKLLGWYSFIAMMMATVFGGMTFVTVRNATFRGIDARLLELAASLSTVLILDDDGSFLVELSNDQLDVFQRDHVEALYYRIWNDRKIEVDSSRPSFDIPILEAPGRRTRANNREIAVSGPSRSTILVGRNIRSELQQLTQLAVTAIVVGTLVMVAMLAGGWFLTGRALAPINRISIAAASISETRLSERIDVTAMESEMAVLAQTVNRAFDRLQEAIERQTRFTADASHEFRTPLTIILAHADRALMSVRSQNEYEEVLKSIRKAAKTMQSVVESLLTLARGDSPQMKLHMQPLNFAEMVEENCELHQSLADQKGISFQYSSIPATVFGNRALLGEAIANLLSNAIKYTPPNGHINVNVECDEDDVVLTVSDDGPGIPSRDQPFVFDRFFRVDKARTSGNLGGVGLGLAITKSIAETHGGHVSLRSQEGSGSSFILRLKKTTHRLPNPD